MERSQKHIQEFGENKEIIWKPDGTSIVIQVSTKKRKICLLCI